MRLLVIAAHTDDEVLLCGGTLHKAAGAGHETTVLFCTRNEQGRSAAESVIARRQRAESEAEASSRILSFDGRFLAFADMQLGDAPGALLQALIGEIRATRPDIVITHSADDWHIDHRALGRAVPEAALQSGYALAGAEPWKPAAVLHGEVDLEGLGSFQTHLVSVLDSAAIQAREAALACYPGIASDHGETASRLPELLAARAAQRGAVVSAAAGEAFALSPLVPLDGRGAALLAELLP